MTLRAAPHQVDVYRRTSAGTGPFGEPWTRVAQAVDFDVQLPSGGVQQEPVGRVAVAQYPAFANHDADIRPDDGLLIAASEITAMIGRRLIVRSGLSMGVRGGWQGSVEDTRENFGA